MSYSDSYYERQLMQDDECTRRIMEKMVEESIERCEMEAEEANDILENF